MTNIVVEGSNNSVYQAFILDPKVRNTSEYEKEWLCPFVELLPDILKDYLGKPFNLNNALQVKRFFLQYCLDHGLFARGKEILPEDTFGFISVEDALNMAQELSSELVPQLDQILANIPTFLAQNNISEDQVMLNQFSLSAELAHLYDLGQLTVADVVYKQPAVIVLNK